MNVNVVKMNVLPKLMTQIYLIDYEKSNDYIQYALADGNSRDGRLVRGQ